MKRGWSLQGDLKEVPAGRRIAFIIAVGVAVAVGLWALFEKTWYGRTVRATASDREMANAIGVNVPWVFSGVFMFGAMLAALGGALRTPVRVVAPGIGQEREIQLLRARLEALERR